MEIRFIALRLLNVADDSTLFKFVEWYVDRRELGADTQERAWLTREHTVPYACETAATEETGTVSFERQFSRQESSPRALLLI